MGEKHEVDRRGRSQAVQEPRVVSFVVFVCFVCFFFFFFGGSGGGTCSETRFHIAQVSHFYGAKDDLELLILLSLPSKC